MAKRLNLSDKLAATGRRLAVQGELIGPGIQKNRYQLKQQELFVFNIFDIDQYAYLDKAEMANVCEQLELTTVPVIDQQSVPASIDEILKLAEGKSVLNTKTEREGLVWVHGSGQDRISFKTISNKFLARNG